MKMHYWLKSRVKHINIKYHFIKYDIFYKSIELIKIDNKI